MKPKWLGIKSQMMIIICFLAIIFLLIRLEIIATLFSFPLKHIKTMVEVEPDLTALEPDLSHLTSLEPLDNRMMRVEGELELLDTNIVKVEPDLNPLKPLDTRTMNIKVDQDLKTLQPLDTRTMKVEVDPDLRKLGSPQGIQLFANVCIESLPLELIAQQSNPTFHESKQIVVYDQTEQPGRRTIEVAGSSNTLWNHWTIEFRKEALPLKMRAQLRRNVAFFVQPTCPGNFHHFFIDEFLPLYSIVQLYSRIFVQSLNQILYRTPHPDSDFACSNRTRYETLLWTLNAEKWHDVFYNVPDNTCFSYGIFGSKPYLTRPRDIIHHVLKHFNVSTSARRNACELNLTIILRESRRILNVDELTSLARKVGFSNVRTVDFARESVENQVKIAASSTVLVGVQGAGLQWAAFMPENSHLVEIAWPLKYWEFYYCAGAYVSDFGIRCHQVAVQDVRVNWTSYEANVPQELPLSESAKTDMLKNTPKSVPDNLWKWADVVVQEGDIRPTLEEIFRTFS